MPQYLRPALADFDEGSYDNLITRIDVDNPPDARGPIDETKTIKALGHYYKGLAFIEKGNAAGAIKNLRWVTDSVSNDALVIKARWYLALTYLKAGNTEKAIPGFTILAGNPKANPYNRQAKEILQPYSNDTARQPVLYKASIPVCRKYHNCAEKILQSCYPDNRIFCFITR